MRNLPHNESNSPVSTNTVLHFTSQFEAIKGIVSEGFRVSTCREFPVYLRISHEQETFNKLFGEDLKPIEEIPIPMVCFCDTPKRIRFNHMKKYGYYGIELTKKWAINNFISPVCYIPSNTKTNNTINGTINNLYKLAEEINRLHDEENDVEFAIAYTQHVFSEILKYMSFVKDYQDEKTLIKYYDEREWRYLPDNGREKENLTFTFEDIVAIYVRSAKEKREINEIIREKYNKEAKKLIIVSNRK